MRSSVFAFALLCAACGARTELSETDELDGSLPDVSLDDVVYKDVAQDATEDAALDSTPDVSDGSEQDAEIDAGFDSGPQCIPDCTHNYQCEISCPPISTGRWCCDDQTGVCYAFAGKHCPHPIFDAGFD